MNRYNFDQMIDRRNTDCVKYDGLQDVFGCADLLPMWVADMDFRVPPEVQEAARKCCEQGIFGYTFRSDDGKDAFRNWVKQRYRCLPAPGLLLHWRFLSGLLLSPAIR